MSFCCWAWKPYFNLGLRLYYVRIGDSKSFEGHVTLYQLEDNVIIIERE
jgi:hypothetical protein